MEFSAILMMFDGTNGAAPLAGLTLAGDGNFYGSTVHGGSENSGTIFKITHAGAFSQLASFTYSFAATEPDTMLTEGPDGNLYGLTAAGGDYNSGVAFRASRNGVLTNLVSLQTSGYTTGGAPAGRRTLQTIPVCSANGGANGLGAVFEADHQWSADDTAFIQR